MVAEMDLQITETLTIPLHEIHWQFSRSSGPGGQHVNRTETQVELLFDVLHSPSLEESQRTRLLERLKTIIDSRGVLHLTSQATRSQHRNRADVLERFQTVLQQALHVPKARRRTRPSRAAAAERLAEKRRSSTTKEGRRQRWTDTE